MKKSAETTSPAERLARSLQGCRSSGDGFIACCPAHDDRNPSLSINEGENGKILVHCHAGCEQDEVISALNELNLWHENSLTSVWVKPREDSWRMTSAPRGMRSPDFGELCGSKPADVYEYRDGDGRLRGFICRLDDPVGHKSFRPVTPWVGPNGNRRWRIAGFANPKPLFGLLDLARRPHAPVLIVEGEKVSSLDAPYGTAGDSI